MDQESLMRRAVALSRTSVERGGLPFGAVVALGGEIIGEAYNEVAATSDPTAHAEIVAIRRAAARRGHFKLEGFILYASSEPCPMCLAAAHWVRIEKSSMATQSRPPRASDFLIAKSWNKSRALAMRAFFDANSSSLPKLPASIGNGWMPRRIGIERD
jgi:tRNA(Arg) A34 adenosine deaminase TadA